MADLSRWDFATAFTAHEAAALILGRLPITISHVGDLEPIYGRMRQCYEPLESWFKAEVWRLTRDNNVHISAQRPLAEISKELAISFENEKKLRAADCLESEKIAEGYARVKEASLMPKTLFSAAQPSEYEFINQRFSRIELVRWLTVIKVKSVYQFDLGLVISTGTKLPEKTVETRERNILLSIIALLCDELRIDHTKPSKAAVLIHDMATRKDISIGETTIAGHLRKIPDALGSRAT